jgi:hypothetical protein
MMNTIQAAVAPRAVPTTKPANPTMAAVQEVAQAYAPVPVNMGVKDSGAPVNFSPTDQARMASTFGQSYQNKYERSVGPLMQAQPIQPPAGVATPVVPPYDLNN